jgi:hypothetical protein
MGRFRQSRHGKSPQNRLLSNIRDHSIKFLGRSV